MTTLIKTDDQISHIHLTFQTDRKPLTQFLAKKRQKMIAEVEIPGYRPGKAPDFLLNKYIDFEYLESALMDDEVNFLVDQIKDYIYEPKRWIDADKNVIKYYFPIGKIERLSDKVNFELVANVVPILDLEPAFAQKPEVEPSTDENIVKGGWLAKEDFFKQAYNILCQENDLWKEVNRPAQLWDKMIATYTVSGNDSENGTYIDDIIYIDLDDETKQFNQMFIGLKPQETKTDSLSYGGVLKIVLNYEILCTQVFEPKYTTVEEAFKNEADLTNEYSGVEDFLAQTEDGYQEQLKDHHDMMAEVAYQEYLNEYVKTLDLAVPTDQIEAEAQEILHKLTQLSKLQKVSLTKILWDEYIFMNENKRDKKELTDTEIFDLIQLQIKNQYLRVLLYDSLDALHNPYFNPKLKYVQVFKPQKISMSLLSESFDSTESEEPIEESSQDEEGDINGIKASYLSRRIVDMYIRSRFEQEDQEQE